MTGLGSSCGACKFLRRKCATDCVFAPYFCYDQAAAHFLAVHKVFGASNFSKLLLHLPMHVRSMAAMTVSYEALARMQDPVYGCVAHILALQQQVVYLQKEIELLENQMATAWFQTDGCTASPRSTNDIFELQDYWNAKEIPLHLTEAPVAITDNQNNIDISEVKICTPGYDPRGREIVMHCSL